MAHSDTRIDDVRSCVIDGCSNDVVCVEVYVRHRRQPLHAIHRLICTTHAVSEGIGTLDDHVCDETIDAYIMDESRDLERAMSDDISRSYQ